MGGPYPYLEEEKKKKKGGRNQKIGNRWSRNLRNHPPPLLRILSWDGSTSVWIGGLVLTLALVLLLWNASGGVEEVGKDGAEHFWIRNRDHRGLPMYKPSYFFLIYLVV